MDSVPPWQEARHAFAPDGMALRDVYVLNTTREDWGRFIDFLARSQSSPRITRGDEHLSLVLPEDFPNYPEDAIRPSMEFRVAGLICKCYFFWDKDIEFDIWASEMRSEDQYTAFVTFLRKLRDHLNKDVVLTEENSPETTIVRLRAQGS
jgi:hypothetical protein